MHKPARRALGIAVAGMAIIGLVTPTMAAAPAGDRGAGKASRIDNHPGPLTERQNARRKAAQELILSGKASPNKEGVVALADDKYYQASITDAGKFFAILAEFGTDGSGKLGTAPGPLHNEIPEPNRETVDGQVNDSWDPTAPYDNFRHWVGDAETGESDFDRETYLDLLFTGTNSFKAFYEDMSGGLFTIDGDAAGAVNPDNGGWIKVPGNASTYGDNTVEDFGGSWQFIEDAANTWYSDATTDLGGKAAVDAYLAQFDVWDRYDFDNDGEFDEPDGYIDHFSAIHAGEGEDAGGGAQGADAIWSHRWYVNGTDFGTTGPNPNAQFGGTEIGNSGIWIGDYTIEAENGGLGVHAHEFGHDLGLPDFYDTNAGENGTAFWTLMSSGSWLNVGGEDIGTKPDYYGPWEKLQLGWLDYGVVAEGATGSFTLDPSEAVIVDVDDVPLSTDYTVPASGAQAWWTSSADDLNTTLTLDQSLNLSGARSATATAKVWYDIEEGYDFLYAEYSTDGGAHWLQIGTPLDGSSSGRWTNQRYTIPGGGANTMFRFRYQTDGGVHLDGAFIDDITIKTGGTTLFGTDTVEYTEENALWNPEGGFRLSSGTEKFEGDRYYIAENRTYVGYDATLETGPYQFSFAVTDPDKVEHFPFQDGLLIWMVDETYTDNDNSAHAGHGLALPVDAHYQAFKFSDGTQPSNRRQPFDATFGTQNTPAGPTFDPEPDADLSPSDPLPCGGLHKQVVTGHGPTQALEYLCAWPGLHDGEGTLDAISKFDDSNPEAYWDSTNPQNSTLVAGYGTEITVTEQNTGGTVSITVDNVPDTNP